MATRKRSAPKPTETQVHAQVAQYLGWALPDNAVWLHVRNERSKASERITASRMGALSGMTDFEVIFCGKAICFEMKPQEWSLKRLVLKTRKINEHEQRQLDVHERLRAAGASVAICESLDDVISFLESHGIPLRARPISEERIIAGFTKAMQEIEK
jgi:hypothetical protein